MGWGLVKAGLAGAGVLSSIPFAMDGYNAASSWGKDRRKEINRMTDVEYDDFKPNALDKIFLGMDGSDEWQSQSDALRNEHIKTGAFKDGQLTSAQRLVESNGGKFIYTPGQSTQQALAANGTAISQAATKQKISDGLALSNANHGSLANQYERGVQRDAAALENRRFNYTMRTNAQNRLDQRADSAEQRADTIRMQIRADERADKRYNQQLAERDRRDRRAAIGDAAGGLVALAAAFAM